MDKIPDNCPNCGAPLKRVKSDYINDMVVTCEYCGSKFEEKVNFTKEKAAQALFSGVKSYREDYKKQQKKMQEYMPYWIVPCLLILVLPIIFAYFYTYSPVLIPFLLPVFLVAIIIYEWRIHIYMKNRKKK